MDPNFIQLALQKMRGQSPDVTGAGSPQAPGVSPMPGLDQAYAAPVAGVPSQTQPFQLNQGLENQAQAQGMQAPMNPLIQQIMQHFGMMNMLRNRSNQQVVDQG